jgi:competence protein ComEA
MDISRRQAYVYVGLALVVAALGARYLFSSHSATPAGAQGVPGLSSFAPSAAPSPSPSPTSTELVAYVCGAVRRPGVYHLPSGARVADLLAAAGGAAAKAELQAVNLAAKVVDGQQVVVPERGATAVAAAPATGTSGSSGSGSGAAAAPVNLNTASAEELDALPGVGPATAQKIIDYRTANVGFKSVDDLKNVAGIGDAKFATLQPLVTV